MPLILWRRIGACSLVLAALGCSGQTIESPPEAEGSGGTGGTGDAGGTGGTDAGGTGAGGTGGPVDRELHPQCAVPGGTELLFLDRADGIEKLSGTWALCEGPGVVFAAEDVVQAGVELTADFRWYVLESTESGLARASGFQTSGTWRFQPPPDLSSAPSDYVILFFGVDFSFDTTTLLENPRKMHWQFLALGDELSVYAHVGPEGP